MDMKKRIGTSIHILNKELIRKLLLYKLNHHLKSIEQVIEHLLSVSPDNSGLA